MGRVTLKSRFPEIVGTLPRRVSANLKEGAERIASQAEANVNVGPVPAHIADSVEVHGGAGEFEVGVFDPELFYAKFVEFGRANAPPYPFLVPAAEQEAPEILDDVQKTLNTL